VGGKGRGRGFAELSPPLSFFLTAPKGRRRAPTAVRLLWHCLGLNRKKRKGEESYRDRPRAIFAIVLSSMAPGEGKGEEEKIL